MTEQPKATWYRAGRFVEDDAPDWWIRGYAATRDAAGSADPGGSWEDLLCEHAGLKVLGSYGIRFSDDIALYCRDDGPEYVARMTVCGAIFDVLIASDAELLTFRHNVLAMTERERFYEEVGPALAAIKNVLIAIARYGLEEGRRITNEGEHEDDVNAREQERRRLRDMYRPKAPAAAE